MDKPFSTGPTGPVISTAIDDGSDKADSRYSNYVMCALLVVYMFNAMDRSIMSILAEDIKKTFTMSDSQLGFLHGTAFGIFYALFGYPIGRLLDRANRTKVLAGGIALWSGMTVVCGLSTSYAQMVFARIGVAVGEASASPAGFSLISDWFTKAKRGTALGIFIGGMYIGAGLALIIGGFIVARWALVYPGEKPFGLLGWQVSFLVVGLPGLLVAFWLTTLREPRRGLSDGIFRPRETQIWSRFLVDLTSVLPPLTLIQAYRSGLGPFLVNIAVAILAAICGVILSNMTGDKLQWMLLSMGYYAAFSAAQSMKHNDYPTFKLTWGTPTFVMAMIGFGAVSAINVVMVFWAAPLSLRSLMIDKGTAGLVLGITTATCGVLGVMMGGRAADILIRYSHKGRVYVGIVASIIPVPFIIAMCNTHNPWIFFLCNIPVAFFLNIWIAAGAATVAELVLPRMRGTATTTYFLASTMGASGLAPYAVGKVSMATGDLANGILWSLIVAPLAVLTLWICARGIQGAESTKWDRAYAAGEPRHD